ncbi:DUF397 domain-containing protein [Spirillospora sp. NPDC052269]
MNMDPARATWRRSSYSGGSGGQCVEVADLHAIWRKSSHSGGSGGDCVEIADLAAAIGVRDSKDPGGPVLVVSRGEAVELMNRVRRRGGRV